ncbi:hypothetical protein [Salmonella phage SD-2_S15]|nr:hypothetical protein [Salmonella phage SD-2_S15]
MLRYMFNIKFYIVFFRVQSMFPETKKYPAPQRAPYIGVYLINYSRD